MNKKTQEQLLNRILINFAIAVPAYIFLYVIYAKFYLAHAIEFAIAFIVLAIVLYIISAVKIKKLRNYAHMFLAFGICLLFTRLSIIIGSIVGIEKLIELTNSSKFFEMLVNSRYDVILITWLGIAYLVGMLIYNTVLMGKTGKK